MVIVKGQEEGDMESYCLMGMMFQSGKKKNVLKMDDGDTCTTV